MKSMILLMIVLLFVSCGGENEQTSCSNRFITESGFRIKDDQLCLFWDGYELLSLDILDKKSGITTENNIDFGNTCVDQLFNPAGEYLLSIYFRCYENGKYQRVFYKNYDLDLCNDVKIGNYSIIKLMNGDTQLTIEEVNGSNYFSVDISKENVTFTNLAYSPFIFSLTEGITYQIKITPVCIGGYLQYSYGEPVTFDYTP